MADDKKNQEPDEKVKRGCAGLFFFLMLVMGSLWGAGLGVFVWVLDDAKSTIEALEEFRPNIGSKVYSSDGELLGQFTIEERQLVPLRIILSFPTKAFAPMPSSTRRYRACDRGTFVAAARSRNR